MVEKPFAANAADARRMIEAMTGPAAGLPINWPLAWYPGHNTAKRLVDEGAIGDLIEMHFYDGNRGPLFHLADKVEVSPEEVEAQKPSSWWYKKASGGGSLLDYLGYGTTLGTWFMNGEAPLEVTSVVDETPGIEVDQHSITVCRYAARPVEIRDPLGHADRSVDAAAAAEMRLRAGRHATAASPATTTMTSSRCRRARRRRRPQVPADTLPAGRRGADRISCWRASRTARRSQARSTRRSASSASG